MAGSDDLYSLFNENYTSLIRKILRIKLSIYGEKNAFGVVFGWNRHRNPAMYTRSVLIDRKVSWLFSADLAVKLTQSPFQNSALPCLPVVFDHWRISYKRNVELMAREQIAVWAWMRLIEMANSKKTTKMLSMVSPDEKESLWTGEWAFLTASRSYFWWKVITYWQTRKCNYFS